MVQGIDQSFDVLIPIGYHPTKKGVETTPFLWVNNAEKHNQMKEKPAYTNAIPRRSMPSFSCLYFDPDYPEGIVVIGWSSAPTS